MRLVHEIIMISTLTIATLGCGPEASEGADVPGMLEYEIPTARFYRLDRRVDIVGVDPMNDRSGCGFLTDRAYEDLTGTLEGIDSNAEYTRSDCTYSPDGLLYIEGFTYSPFPCTWYCCHDELLPAAIVYFAVGSALYGPDPNINGEIYVALEPDNPCPD